MTHGDWITVIAVVFGMVAGGPIWMLLLAPKIDERLRNELTYLRQRELDLMEIARIHQVEQLQAELDGLEMRRPSPVWRVVDSVCTSIGKLKG